MVLGCEIQAWMWLSGIIMNGTCRSTSTSTVIYVWPAVRAAPVWSLAVGVDCCMQSFFRLPPLESFFRSSPHLTAVASTQCEY